MAEKATLGSAFDAASTIVNHPLEMHQPLHYLGVKVKEPTIEFGDNESIVKGSTIPNYHLHKCHTILAYRHVCEAVAAGVIRLNFIPAWMESGRCPHEGMRLFSSLEPTTATLLLAPIYQRLHQGNTGMSNSGSIFYPLHHLWMGYNRFVVRIAKTMVLVSFTSLSLYVLGSYITIIEWYQETQIPGAKSSEVIQCLKELSELVGQNKGIAYPRKI